MFNKKEDTQKVAWYVTIYSNGIVRTYNFRNDKERDWMYEFFKDRFLRCQATEINDSKEEEKIFIHPKSAIIKGKTELNIFDDLKELELFNDSDIQFHKRDELVLSVLGAKV